MSDKYFAWYEKRGFASSRAGRTYREGPYYSSWCKIVEPNRVHSIEELRKIPFSKTIASRIESARPGTAIKIHRMSASSDLYVERLTDDEYDKYIEFLEAKMNLERVKKEIQAAVPGELLKEKQILEKEIRETQASHSWLA